MADDVDDGGYARAAFMVAVGTLDALVKAEMLPKSERAKIMAASFAMVQRPTDAPARELLERFQQLWRLAEEREATTQPPTD